jgi:hypothetical protein
MIFREMFYGQYGTNSKLEKNCKAMVPNGIEWKIIYTAFGGKTVEISRTRTGRATQKNILKSLVRSSSTNIKALIARNKLKKAEAKKDSETN